MVWAVYALHGKVDIALCSSKMNVITNEDLLEANLWPVAEKTA